MSFGPYMMVMSKFQYHRESRAIIIDLPRCLVDHVIKAAWHSNILLDQYHLDHQHSYRHNQGHNSIYPCSYRSIPTTLTSNYSPTAAHRRYDVPAPWDKILNIWLHYWNFLPLVWIVLCPSSLCFSEQIVTEPKQQLPQFPIVSYSFEWCW